MTDADQPARTEPEHIDGLTRAFDLIADAIRSVGDRQKAFEQTLALLDRIDELRMAALDLRDQMIAGIWDAEKLSLARLANKVGISKARADQIVREQTGRPTQRKPHPKPAEETPDD